MVQGLSKEEQQKKEEAEKEVEKLKEEVETKEKELKDTNEQVHIYIFSSKYLFPATYWFVLFLFKSSIYLFLFLQFETKNLMVLWVE